MPASPLPASDRATSRFDRFYSPVGAWIILGLVIGLTSLACYVSLQSAQEAALQRFNFRTEQLTTAIDDRTVVYEQVLWGTVGLVKSSDHVSRAEWREYVSTLDIDEHWPGIQGLGYSVPLAPEEIDAHIAEVRADGYPDFVVWPEEARREYSSILYLEPFDERNQRAFGYDMWSNPVRREAMTRARDSGDAATSGVITLVQETDQDVQRGFITYTPVYEGKPTSAADRESSLTGWVYAAFRMGDLMEGILDERIDDVSYEIFDGAPSEETLLFDSDGTFAGTSDIEGSDFEQTSTLEVQGREWTIIYNANPGFLTRGEATLPTLIGLAGLLVSTAMLYVIWSLKIPERRAKQLAQEMTAELRAAKQRLEERSAELSDYADQLEASNDELERFAYVASHDLQAPLRGLNNYAVLLAEEYGEKMTEEATRWVGYISVSAQRMSDLIRGLLRYASADTSPEPKVETPLAEVVRESLTDLAEAIDDSGAIIDVGPMPSIVGDRFQLERLFANLIGNAIKYRSPDRTPRISVGASKAGDDWRITVSDNGIGIPPEFHDQVFEIFRRVGQRSDDTGTGLGLAMCRKIVASHKGTIGVTSEPGQGSEFWLTLPSIEADDASGRELAADAHRPPARTQSLVAAPSLVTDEKAKVPAKRS